MNRVKPKAFREFAASPRKSAVPEGQQTIAQRFNAGMEKPDTRSPGGTAERLRRRGPRFDRPFGTWTMVWLVPGVETPGYFQDVPPGQSHFEFPKGIRVKPEFRS